MENKRKIIFENLGKNITKIRESKRISYDELSSKTGIRKEYLKKIEKGEAFGMLISHIFLIANGLGVKPHILAEGI